MNSYLEKNVVVPCDFSQQSLNTLNETLAMLDSPEKLRVVHVTPAPAETAVVWGQITEDIIEERIREKYDDFVGKSNLPDLDFSVLFGDAGSRITEFAKDQDAGLIVIASHGRSGLNRLLMGSVAERVVRLANCPVLVLRQASES